MSARYEIVACEQGTPEWFEARLGMPTASRFKDIVAQGQGKMRRTYMNQLVGEIMSGEPMKTYSNSQMERGKEDEPMLRDKYAFDTECDVAQVGFVKMNPALCSTGCSPDGLVGDFGMIEIKSVETHILVETLRTGMPPDEHLAQIQGSLWITGRKWCDLVVGCSSPKMPIFIHRIRAADTYIGPLSVAVKQFNAELAALVKELQEK